MQTRQIEAFGRKVTATASHLMGDATSNAHYPSPINSLSRQMRRPGLQRGVFSFAQTSPRDLVRSKLSTSEISHRAITYLSDDILENIPEDANTYSLFQGFQATLPEGESEHRKSHRRRTSKSQKLLSDASPATDGPPSLDTLKKDRNTMNHRLEMMGVRKNLCSTEIHEIDNKITNLNTMRKIVLDRLANLENDEAQIEHECEWRNI
jgi:mitochondrial division protein 1